MLKLILNSNHIGAKYSLIELDGGGGHFEPGLKGISNIIKQGYILFIKAEGRGIMVRTQAILTNLSVALLNLPPPPPEIQLW